ncbi:acyl-ACP--UDP-N-acetylglucosamine O-acyltransferase [Pseudanabaena sp. FACHB-1277]|jgi:UDP-N-acetylglucosamine acyltransferase|uniref:Acyl-ACP--UDP-N-acetylglucosamine O-acyltransferase n=1 Tax=Pseudanabaena cinerea FACHB-1277 TaxID=2949581 RepID=A0A926UUA7_9CYAN|nr:acyl-ACP--UDP-N-acetylglucosamine O-acyltransferase [Pseudanabaena cinerea]MBD2150160.1 acyl-ACP--UDP-N-acetylglucosamine O-acyltransferase [Pseudanabaena cinerea FACHB-1277]
MPVSHVPVSEFIHPTAIVHPDAQLHPTVKVGAYAVIGEQVKIGAHSVIGHHAIVEGHTEIGDRNHIYPGAAIGLDSQDLKYLGADSLVQIGNDNRIREYVTINRANEAHEVTRIGNGNLLMAYVHVGHNCEIEDRVIIANGVALAGHVHIESNARLSGVLGVHQFVRIGRLSMIGGMSRIERDVPPYILVEGNPSRVRTLNRVGIDRAGLDADTQQALKSAFRLLYHQDLTLADALEKLAIYADNPHVQHLRQFLQDSITLPKRRGLIPHRH